LDGQVQLGIFRGIYYGVTARWFML